MAKMLLSDMVVDLRAEAGHSLLLGQGTNMEDTLKYYLRRTQRELYTGFDWPQFMVYETLPVLTGTRFLDPFTTIDAEQINTLSVMYGGSYTPLVFGFAGSDYDPDSTTTGALARYRYSDVNDSVEVWPHSGEDTTVMAYGQMMLPALVANSDTSLLDGQLIVMFAAANILARQKSEDAGLVLSKAQAYLVSLQKQNGSQKRFARSMAVSSGGRRPRAGLDYISPSTQRP